MPTDQNTKTIAPPPAGARQRLWFCAKDGTRAGLSAALRLLYMMIPVSLAVAMLDYFGVLAMIAPYLQPVMKYLGLPGESVLPFISAVFLSVYSGIAALGAIEITDRQLTIIAMMMLIAHNIPVESAIQHKAHTPMWRMTLLRLLAAFAAAALLNLLLPAGDPAPRARGVAATSAAAFWPFLLGWALGTLKLSGTIIGLVIGLMILQRLLKEFKVMDALSVLLRPLLWVLGLPGRLAFLWIIGNALGLAYGSGIILEEVESGTLTPKDAQLLNRSLAICHSLLEDTLLFVAIGAWAFWITVPRLALAAVVVWSYRAASLILSQKPKRV